MKNFLRNFLVFVGLMLVSVTAFAAKPNYTYPTSVTVYVGVAFTITPTAGGGAPTSVTSLPTLPTGWTINQTTGVITGTPTLAQVGSGTYVLTLANTQTQTTNPSITITVVNKPNFSYSPAVNYPLGTAMTLSPVNAAGGGPVSTTKTVSTTGTVILNTGATTGNLSNPYGLAVDPSGNVYVANYARNTIVEYSTGGTVTTYTLAAGTGPVGIAFDSSGNAYVLGQTSNSITKYTGGMSGTANTTFVTGLFTPTGIFIDASNNIYVGNSATNGAGKYTINKYSTSGGTPTLTFNTNSTAYPVSGGIAVDATGNIYVVDDDGGNFVDKYSSTGTYTSETTYGGNPDYALYIDGSGNDYLTGGTSAYLYSSGFVSTQTLSPPFSSPRGIVTDQAGNVYVSDYTAGTVTKYAPTTGYMIASGGALPAGLVFNNTTGTISGTPTVVATGTYTVSGSNGAGSFTCASFTINCGAPVLSYTATPYSFTTGVTNTTVTITNTGGAISGSYTFTPTSGSLPAGITFNTTNGTFTCVPTAAGTVTGNVTASNVAGSSSATITITVTNPAAPVLSYAGTPYSFTAGVTNTTATISDSGGAVVGSYTFTITSGALPAGITFNTANGTFTCIPTAAGAVTGNVTGTNAGGTGSAPISITVTSTPAPVLSYAGTPYSFTTGITNTTATISNSGGPVSGTYTFTITSGALPAGITFNTANGTFTCIPTAAGTVTGNVTGTNTGGTGSAPITITVTNPPVPVLSYSGTPYTFVSGVSNTTVTINNTGGTVVGSYTFTITSGALPTGITFNTANGTFTCIPTATGTVTGNVTASNAGGTGSAPITITVNPPVPIIAYTPSTYTFTVGVTGTTSAATSTGGAVATYSFDASTPAPAYLSINTSTGVITSSTSSVAAAAATYKIDGTNVTGTGTTTVTISEVAVPTLTYATPNTFTVGTAATLTPGYGTGGTPTSVVIASIPAGTTLASVGLAISATGVITGTPTATLATTTFVVTATDAGGSANSNNFTITINPALPIIAYSPATYTFGVGVTGATSAPTSTGGAVATYSVDASTPFPAYLSINAATGVITSSTSSIAAAAATYKIDATNVTGTASTTVTITELAKPILAYTTPNNYTVGTAITTLSPTNTGGAVSATKSFTTPGTVILNAGTNGLNKPLGMAVDPSGNVYVANFGANSIVEYSTTGTVTTYSTGAGSGPVGLVFDSSGNAYVLDQTTNKVEKYTGGMSGTASTFETGFATPSGIAIDASNNIYVGNSATVGGNYIISKFASTGGAATLTFNTNGAAYPVSGGIAVDASGNIWVVDNDGGSYVDEYSSAGAFVNTAIYGGGTTNYGIYIDGANNDYLGGVASAYPYTPGFATVTQTITGFTSARGIVTDGSGNLYVADYSANTVTKYVPNSGYVLNGTLPPGLAFSSTTGKITGTPTAAYSGTYTVTGYNAAGAGTSNTFVINCASPPAFTYTPATNTYPVGTAITALTPVVTAGSPITGYAVTTGTLPAGLSIAPGTGVISGTPTAAYATTTLTITATGSSGLTGTTTITITCILPPNISYTTPNNYDVGTAIATLSPTSTGGAVPATQTYSTTGNVVLNAATNGLNEPEQMAVDPSGNVYVANFGANSIVEYSTTGTVTTYSTGAGTGPIGLVFDSSGNAYVLEATAKKVIKFTGGMSGAQSTIITGTATPTGIAIDGSNNLYLANIAGTNTITKYTTAGGTPTLTITAQTTYGAYVSAGIAVDQSGNIYAVDNGFGTKYVDLYNSAGVYQNSLNSGGASSALSIDGGGNVLYTRAAQGRVYSPGFGGLVQNFTGFTTADGIIADSKGDVYIADYAANTVTKYAPTTGYYLNGILPPGLSFSNTTGQITGTPTAAFSGTYTVTAYNSAGSSYTSNSFVINCAIVPVFTYTPATNIYTVGTAITPLTPAVTEGTPITGYAVTTGTLPAGLTINASTGVISGTPTAAYATATLTITATGSTGLTGTTTITLTCVTPPILTYTTPNNYTVGVNIPTLSPTNTGGAVSATQSYSTTGTVILNGGTNSLNKPDGLAVDASNDIFVTNFGANTVTEYSASGTVTTYSTGAGSGPIGIVFDSAGNAYVLEQTLNTVVKFTGGMSGAQSTIITGLNTPTGIAIDNSNNLYVGNSGNNTISEYPPAGGTATISVNVNTGYGSNVSGGIAVDASGNIYATDNIGGRYYVDQYQPGLVNGEIYYTVGNVNSGISIDASGNIFMTTTGSKDVEVYGPSFSSSIQTITPPFGSPRGVVTDGLGNLYVSDYTANTVTKFKPTSGYYLTGTLPPGLTFSTTTGQITGRPTITYSGSYTVTGYNVAGSGVSNTFVINCTSNPPAITYTPATNVYLVGTAITPLSPVNSGGNIIANAYGTGVPVTSLTLSTPYGMAVDAAGDVWVVNYGSTTVNEYKVGGTTATFTVASTKMVGIAVDASGNFYVLNTNGTIYTYNSAGLLQSTNTTINTYRTGAAGSGLGIAIDAAGNLYVSDGVDKAVWKYTASTGTTATLITNILTYPAGLQVDGSGNIYVLDEGATHLAKYSALGSFISNIVTGLNAAYGLYIDAYGNYYIADAGAKTVKEYNYAGTLEASITTGLTAPRGVVTDPSGNLWVSDYGAGTVTEYPPNYYILSGGTLPTGLSFNPATGTFSGTPTAVFPTTTFTITVQGVDGSVATTHVTITCTTAPVITYTTPDVYTDGTAISPVLTPTQTGSPYATVTYAAPSLPAGLTINASTGVISGTPTAVTPATVYTVTASNAVASGTFNITITCNAAPPIISYTTPDVYTIGTTITPLTPTSTGGAVVTYSAATLPAGLSIDPVTGIISGAPTTITPANNYVVMATNTGGTVNFTINITCNAPAPIISYVTPQVYTVGTPIPALNPTSTGGGVVSYSVSPALPAGLSIDPVTGVISGTPTAVTAPVNYFVTATNTGGTSTFEINITCVGSAPAFTYTTPDTYPVGSVIAPLAPTNTGGTPVSYSVSPGLPAGLTLNTGTGVITGTPTAVSPATNYVVTATNTGGSATFTINITCTMTSPVFTYTTPNIFPVGTAITPLSPANTGSSPVSYAISATLPTGLTFNTTTGVISGTPTVTSPPTTYTITATDASSNTGTFNISIACSNGNDWVGTSTTNNTDWNDPTNWSAGTVPAATDVANIGVNVAFTGFPTVLTGESPSVGSVQIGTQGGQAGGITVNTGATLAVSGAITYQSDANAGAYTAALSGAGAITAGGISVIANTTLGTPATYTETLASSVSSLALSSNISLTSTADGSGNALNATFNITGGTVSVAGIVQTSNSANSTSALNVAPAATATLQLGNTAALSGLSGTGTNTISFNNPGATIEYSGAMQTYYTNAAITGLATGVSYNSIKFSGSGLKSPNGTTTNTLNISGDFTNALTLNDGSDYIDLSEPTVNFTNSGNQIIAAGNGTGTTFYTVNFNGTGTTTIQSGSAYLNSTSVLTMGGTSSTLAAGGNLTLNSDVNGTATIAAIPAGCSITGLVNVQRYLTGGASNDRGYRLLSSSVSTTAGSGIYELNYVKNSSYVTGTTGAAGGFDGGGNPTLYFFRENLVPNNSSFTSGNYRGVNNIISYLPGYYMDVDNGPFNLPVGNGFLFFFRGDRSQASFAAETTVSYIPTGTTLTETGYLNQGAVNVNSWYTPNGTGLIYTTISGTTTVEGFNLVGNPYPSSIDWDKYSTTASAAGVYAPNVGPFIYILNSKSGNYNVYQSGTGGVGTVATTGSNVIPGGQGFFVIASQNNAALTFNEAGKTNAQATAAQGNLFMGTPLAAAVPQYLHLALVQDTLHFDGSIISFNNSASQNYISGEDAPYRKGNGPVSLSSYSGDNIKLAINKQPLPNQIQKNIPLSVLVSADGQYNIKLDAIKAIPALYEIWLKDAFSKDSLDIRNNPSYAFNATLADTTTYSNRFSLVIRQNPALMVHLLNFTANKITGGDQVLWTTENEENYTNFTVQRSTDGGKTFNVLDGVASDAQGTYSYLDKAPVQGANSYRLQITDLNGTISYSNVVTIMYANTNNQIALNGMMVYPNPTAGTINLSITSNQATANKPAYNIEIVNNLGSVIKTAASSSPQWQSDVTTLVPGTYFIRVIDTSNNTVIGKTAFVKL